MGYHFSSGLAATPYLCLIFFKITRALAIILELMRKKSEINRIKIKGGCQSGRKGVTHNTKSDLPLEFCWKSKVITINSNKFGLPNSNPQTLGRISSICEHTESSEHSCRAVIQLNSALEGPGVTKPGKQIKIHHLSNTTLFFEGYAYRYTIHFRHKNRF